MEEPKYYGERFYYCQTGDSRSPAKPSSSICSLIEAVAVRGLDDNLVWFKSSLAFYPKDKEIDKALSQLIDYLNSDDPLYDRLDRRKRADGGISICHKRRIISPDFLNNPRLGRAMVKDEALAHVVIKPPLSQYQVFEVNNRLTRACEEANHKREEAAQLAYYHSLLAKTNSESEVELIEECINRLVQSDKPITKRSAISNRSRRTRKALRSIRSI